MPRKGSEVSAEERVSGSGEFIEWLLADAARREEET
jgi:hypothetical protein